MNNDTQPAPEPVSEIAGRDYGLDDDGLCDCCGEPWDQCKHFFENWICGLMPDGSCSLAGTEECDWECPRNG